jgi:hypothetical protein
MHELAPARVLELLLHGDIRYRTGILEIAPSWLGREPEIAARLGVDFADLRERVLREVQPDQQQLDINWRRLIDDDLGGLVANALPRGGCILVANLDLFVSSLRAADRERFWRALREAYRHRWALLLALPSTNRRLISPAERERWVVANRLAAWNE